MEKSSILLGFILVAGICVISAVNQENKKEALYKRTSLILTIEKNSKQSEMTQGWVSLWEINLKMFFEGNSS